MQTARGERLKGDPKTLESHRCPVLAARTVLAPLIFLEPEGGVAPEEQLPAVGFRVYWVA